MYHSRSKPSLSDTLVAGKTFVKFCVSWQHVVKVRDTVEKAPRWRRLESCSKVKLPEFLKTSSGGKGTPVAGGCRRVPTIRRRRLLGVLVCVGWSEEGRGEKRTLIRGPRGNCSLAGLWCLGRRFPPFLRGDGPRASRRRGRGGLRARFAGSRRRCGCGFCGWMRGRWGCMLLLRGRARRSFGRAGG